MLQSFVAAGVFFYLPQSWTNNYLSTAAATWFIMEMKNLQCGSEHRIIYIFCLFISLADYMYIFNGQ